MSAMLDQVLAGASIAQQAQQAQPRLLWTYALAHVAIALSLFSIPMALVVLVRRRRDVRFNGLLIAFSIFLTLCGLTNLMSIWAAWQGYDWLDAPISLLTALAVVGSAVVLWLYLPKLIALPDNAQLRSAIAQLQHEVEERQQAELALRESQSTLRELADYRDRVREDERKRIAREIHDELGQNLLALRLDVVALQARTRDSQPRLHEQAGTMLECIDATMKCVRSIINNLRPTVLDLGLCAAIEWQVNEFRRTSAIDCALSVEGERREGDLSDEQATAIFRVLQESLTNIHRHARASKVVIELQLGADALSMSVSDDGVGMYPNDRRKTHHFGLVGMQERIAILGGTLGIDSTPGAGTRLQLAIPLQPQQAIANGGRPSRRSLAPENTF